MTVRVAYSSVNYKDALAVTPDGGVVRDYPIVPGIDLTGEVRRVAAPRFKRRRPGAGHGYRDRHRPPRRLRRYARLPIDWVGRPGPEPARQRRHRHGRFAAAMSVQPLIDWGITRRGPIVAPARRRRRIGRGGPLVGAGLPRRWRHQQARAARPLSARAHLGRLARRSRAKPRPLGRPAGRAPRLCENSGRPKLFVRREVEASALPVTTCPPLGCRLPRE